MYSDNNVQPCSTLNSKASKASELVVQSFVGAKSALAVDCP